MKGVRQETRHAIEAGELRFMERRRRNNKEAAEFNQFKQVSSKEWLLPARRGGKGWGDQAERPGRQGGLPCLQILIACVWHFIRAGGESPRWGRVCLAKPIHPFSKQSYLLFVCPTMATRKGFSWETRNPSLRPVHFASISSSFRQCNEGSTQATRRVWKDEKFHA